MSPPVTAKEKYLIDPVTGTKYKAEPEMRELVITFAALNEGVTHDFYAAAVLLAAKKAQAFAADQLKDAFKEIMRGCVVDGHSR